MVAPIVQIGPGHIQRGPVERVEWQLRLIQAVYRSERNLQRGEALEGLRGRCEALLAKTAQTIDGDTRLQGLVHQIRRQVREIT